MTAEEAPDLFRQGMLRIARATGTEEKKWLTEAIDTLETGIDTLEAGRLREAGRA